MILVRWKDLPDFEATWESVQIIQEQFCEFQREDKLRSLAGSNGERLILTYKRRVKRGNSHQLNMPVSENGKSD